MAKTRLGVRVGVAVVVVGGLLAVAFWPSTVPVDVAAVTRGPLVVTVDAEGTTRVRDRYVVSAPVAGRVLRISLEPGDRVERGQLVARIQPETPPLLDARARAEAQAAVDSARASLGRAQAEEQRAKAALAQVRQDVERLRGLVQKQVAAPQELDTREADEKIAQESLNGAVFAARAAASELARAEARLNPVGSATGRVTAVTAPVAGVVLKRLRESESVVPAGDPLLEIGDPRQLEIVADLLSTDAVRVQPGARALIEDWGGGRTLDARARRVDPSGFTKISALGVEEQRVNVILDFTDPVSAWSALGDRYRVQVRIVVWESANVLRVPTAALFREGSAWNVYVVDNGRAKRTPVVIGHQTGQEAEVTSGLTEGATVVVHPGDAVSNGSRIRPRPAEQ